MIDQAMRLFLDACGVDGPLVLGVEEPGTAGVSWRVFDQPYIIVGRDPGADLYLNDPRVSRRHAYFQMIAGRLFVVDLQSRTGTHWSGEPGIWGWVQRDSGITIGPYRLRPRTGGVGHLTSPEAGAPAVAVPMPVPVSRAFDQPNLPEATLEISGGPAGTTTWRVSRSLNLIGSSLACKVQLEGGGVAPIHASLLRTPAGCFVVDLLGKNGILVNGERVRSARLGDDDLIAVGPHRVRVRLAPSSLALAKPARALDAGHLLNPPSSRPGPELPARLGETPLAGPLAALDSRDVSVSLLRAMLDESHQVHEQAADRFQQSLMAVLQSFASIHGEQMNLIRAELDQIRQLTEEQQTLRARVEGQGLRLVGPPALRLVTDSPSLAAGGPPPTRSAQVARNLTIREGNEPGRVTPGTNPSPPSAPALAGDLHGQIIHRIAQIQDERQGRWQKLLKSLLD